MLVLIATNEQQGADPKDYSFTVEGELVTPVANECASGDRCGCARGFPGLASGFATTTAMVVDRPGVTEFDLRDAVFDWLDRGGWIDLLESAAAERSVHGAGDQHGDQHAHPGVDDVDDTIESIIDEHVHAIRLVCEAYSEGSVVVRDGPLVMRRDHPFAA